MEKKTIILIVALALIVAGIAYFESQKVKPAVPRAPSESGVETGAEKERPFTQSSATTTPAGETKLLKDIKYRKAPELAGITGYINAKPGLQISQFRGKVVLIDFWTYTCINCIRTFPHLTAWDKKYRDKGLVIIGVHTPEFEFEKKTENVKRAMEKYGIEYRVVQDNDYATWKAFGNRFWPRKYLIDADGYIRFDHIGEGAYGETEKKIQELLAEIGSNVTEMGTTGMPDLTPTRRTTPELYAGYEFALPRGQNAGNEGGLKPDKTVDYVLPKSLEEDVFYLEGAWQSNPDNLQAKDNEKASILLTFSAHDVNIVADSLEQPLKMDVFIDNKYVSKEQAGSDVQYSGEKAYIVIDEPRLYNVIHADFGTRTLQLTTTSKEFFFSAFTFG